MRNRRLASIGHDHYDLLEMFSTVPLLIIDDLGMRKLPATAAFHCWEAGGTTVLVLC